MPYFEAGQKGPGGFDAGIEQAVAAVLVRSRFSLSRDSNAGKQDARQDRRVSR